MSKLVQVESKFPLILVHTPFGLDFFDKVAKWRISRAYARVNTYMMPAITGLAIFLIIGSLAILFTNPGTSTAITSVGPSANLLIPGLNPYLPIVAGWTALIVTIVVHEAGHGIIARVYGAKVDSTGIVFLAIIPVGAFVNISRDELAKLTLKQKSAVLTAGPLNNMVLAAVSLGMLLFIMSTLTPLANGGQLSGITVVRITEGFPAEEIGIEPGSTIQYVNGIEVTSLQQFGQQIQSNAGKEITVSWIDPDGTFKSSSALISSETPRLGVEVSTVANPQQVLDNYRNANPIALLLPPTLQPNAVPYSDLLASQYTSSVFGNTFAPISNMLFWFWFINFNVGIFNALPIGPLDGGQLYGAVLENKAKSKKLARNANMVLTIAMVGVVVTALGLPYLMSWIA